MNNHMKNVYLMTIATAASVCILTGFEKYPEKQEYSVTVEGSIFGGKPDDRICTNITFDPAWLTQEDNTKYNKELAAFSSILCADSYFRTKDLDKGKQNRVLYEGEEEEAYTWTSFLENVGFSTVEYVESYKIQEKDSDQNDSATMVLAHSTVDDQQDIYVVAIRGCFSLGEWKSAFDLGCEGEDYTAITGEHPEWTETGNFKGYDIAKNRALELIDAFIDKTGDPAKEDCILITGHSRGGSMANQIGAEMEKREGVKAFTYTFNSQAVSVVPDTEVCDTIFNIFDSGDIFTDICPLSEEVVYRHGTDLTCAVKDSEEIMDAIKELVGRDDYNCLSDDAREEYRKLFGEYFPDRASVYEKKSIEAVYDTKEEAEERLALCESLISSENGLGLENLCVPTEISETSEGKYAFSLEYSGATVLTCEAETLAMGAAAGDAACQLLQEDSAFCQIITFLEEHAPELSGGHRLANSYVLTQFF